MASGPTPQRVGGGWYDPLPPGYGNRMAVNPIQLRKFLSGQQ